MNDLKTYLGLGGNISNELGTPIQHIFQAVANLQKNPNIANVKLSSIYRSKAFGVTDQPDFYNAVVALDTTLSPLELLDICQDLEQSAGRVRLRHWGERSLDVDVLLYGDETIQNERLTVPHAGLFERNFVVMPLLELDENLVVNGKKLLDLPIAKNWDGLEVLV